MMILYGLRVGFCKTKARNSKIAFINSSDLEKVCIKNKKKLYLHFRFITVTFQSTLYEVSDGLGKSINVTFLYVDVNTSFNCNACW